MIGFPFSEVTICIVPALTDGYYVFWDTKRKVKPLQVTLVELVDYLMGYLHDKEDRDFMSHTR